MHRTAFAILALASLGSASGVEDSPQAAEQEVVRFDFENGDLQGWAVVDGFIDPDAGIKGFVRKRQQMQDERAEVQQAAKQTFVAAGEIVFATRPCDVDAHYYTCVGRDCVTGKAMYTIGSQLCRLNPSSGELKILLDDPQGTIRELLEHAEPIGAYKAVLEAGRHLKRP
jgi:hypothetical protein